MQSGQPSADAYRAPVGTHDVLPPESARWATLVATFAARAGRFGYGLVMTPAYEHVEVFQRVGEGTDVVRKEMYEFEDKGGRRLALRPEGTAPVVRAYIQHRPTPPWKVWYLSPHFRHEKAQRGPLPPAPPARAPRCSASTTPPSTSRSSPSPTDFLPPSACPGSAWRSTRSATASAGPGTSRRC